MPTRSCRSTSRSRSGTWCRPTRTAASRSRCSSPSTRSSSSSTTRSWLAGRMRSGSTPPSTPGLAASGRFMQASMPPEFAVSWAIVLQPLDGGRTRLIERVRAKYGSETRGSRAFGPALGFGVFLMTRRQMIGLAERARRYAADPLAATAATAPVAPVEPSAAPRNRPRAAGACAQVPGGGDRAGSRRADGGRGADRADDRGSRPGERPRAGPRGRRAGVLTGGGSGPPADRVPFGHDDRRPGRPPAARGPRPLGARPRGAAVRHPALLRHPRDHGRRHQPRGGGAGLRHAPRDRRGRGREPARGPDPLHLQLRHDRAAAGAVGPPRGALRGARTTRRPRSS